MTVPEHKPSQQAVADSRRMQEPRDHKKPLPEREAIEELVERLLMLSRAWSEPAATVLRQAASTIQHLRGEVERLTGEQEGPGPMLHIGARRWEEHKHQLSRLSAELEEARGALRKTAQAWSNVVELRLLPPQHIETAEKLRKARQALSGRALGRGEGSDANAHDDLSSATGSGGGADSGTTRTQSEFAWLIEAPGQNYLGTRTIGHQTRFYWTRDPHKALRFMSKEQADGAMMAVRQLDPSLWAFAVNLGEAWPREHGWFGLGCVSSNPPVSASDGSTRQVEQSNGLNKEDPLPTPLVSQEPHKPECS